MKKYSSDTLRRWASNKDLDPPNAPELTITFIPNGLRNYVDFQGRWNAQRVVKKYINNDLVIVPDFPILP